MNHTNIHVLLKFKDISCTMYKPYLAVSKISNPKVVLLYCVDAQ